MLRTQVKNFGRWDTTLPKIEFEFNCSKNRSTGFSPFEILLGTIPRGPLQLLPLPITDDVPPSVESWIAQLTSIHAQVFSNLQSSYEKYKSYFDRRKRSVSFDIGDLVWVYLSKDRYPQGEYNKLKPKKLGPCAILEKFGNNAYRVELPPGWNISDTFNVAHLHPYYGEFESQNSRASSFKPEEFDAKQSSHHDSSTSSLWIEDDLLNFPRFNKVYTRKKKKEMGK